MNFFKNLLTVTLLFILFGIISTQKAFADINIELPGVDIPAGTEFNITISGEDDDDDDCYWVILENLSTGEDITTNAPDDQNYCKGTRNGDDLYFYIYDPSETGGSDSLTIPVLPAGEYEIRLRAVYGDSNTVDIVPRATAKFILSGVTDPDGQPIEGIEDIVAKLASAHSPIYSTSTLSEIDGSIYQVNIAFTGLPEGVAYKICPLTSPIGKCREKDEFTSFHVERTPTDGTINVAVCGDGITRVKVKGESEQCNPKSDYFHEGHYYAVHLYANDTTIVSSFYFYIYHRFPDVQIADDVVIKAIRNKETDEYSAKILKNGKDVTTKLLLITNPLKVSLSRQFFAGGEKTNNFFLPISGPYGFEQQSCFTITSANASIERLLGSASGNALSPGRYMLQVQEQIREGDSKSLCQGGGFTYYKIPFTVSISEKGERTEILVSQIEVDPDMVDQRKSPRLREFGALPCALGLDAQNKETKARDKIVKCIEYETALGPIGVKPTEFIKTLGRWMMGIAGIAAFAWILYAGYIMLTSQGDQEKLGQAREIITAAVTGLIFLVLSIAILEIIQIDILGLPDFTRGEEVQTTPTPIPTDDSAPDSPNRPGV